MHVSARSADARYTGGVSNAFVQSMAHNFEQALRLMEAALTDCPDDLWQTDLWPDEAPTDPAPAYKQFMAFLTHRGNASSFRYAGQPVHILAGHEDRPAGCAAMQIAVPAQVAGPIPHAHDEFDEAIYVLHRRLLVAGDDEPQEAAAGSMFVAPRGERHGFSNPHGTDALVLGIWAPSPGRHPPVRRCPVAGPWQPGHWCAVILMVNGRPLPSGSLALPGRVGAWSGLSRRSR